MPEPTHNHETPFEQELAAAMRRVDAPQALAVYLANVAELETRAAAKSAAAAPARRRWFTGRLWSAGEPTGHSLLPNWIGGALAAVIVLGSFGAVSTIHQRNVRQQAADREFAASQQITEQALAHARAQLERAGVSLEQ